MIKGTGGPAFAASGNPGQQFVQQEGMTLRDYFAASAMQGDWASQSPEIGTLDNDVSEEVLINRSRVYYRMADAMLKARGE